MPQQDGLLHATAGHIRAVNDTDDRPVGLGREVANIHHHDILVGHLDGVRLFPNLHRAARSFLKLIVLQGLLAQCIVGVDVAHLDRLFDALLLQGIHIVHVEHQGIGVGKGFDVVNGGFGGHIGVAAELQVFEQIPMYVLDGGAVLPHLPDELTRHTAGLPLVAKYLFGAVAVVLVLDHPTDETTEALDRLNVVGVGG